jgi:glycosyltransferase involved in cell wall biosynthesis
MLAMILEQKTPTIGLSLFVRNEEARVGDCLKSVAGLDELKVLDTGSTDRTGEVVRECGGEFITGYEWKGDYADARNASMRLCTTDWILCLGAGERVDAGGVEEIRRGLDMIEKEHPEIEGCAVLMHHGNDQFWSDRIFRNRPEEIYFRGKVHEYSLITKKGQLQDVSISYTPRPEGRPNGNFIIEIEQMCREEPDNMRNQYIAGREYFVTGYLPNAIYWFERYIRTRTMRGIVSAKGELADVYFTLGWCYARMGELEEAKKDFVMALSINADFKEAASMLSQIALAQKDDIYSELNAGRWNLIAQSSDNEGLGFKSKGLF